MIVKIFAIEALLSGPNIIDPSDNYCGGTLPCSGMQPKVKIGGGGGEIVSLAALMNESVFYNKSIGDNYNTHNLLAIYDLMAYLASLKYQQCPGMMKCTLLARGWLPDFQRQANVPLLFPSHNDAIPSPRPTSSDLLVELRDHLVHGILHALRRRSLVRVPRRLLVVLEHVSPHQAPPGDAEVMLLLVRFVHGPGDVFVFSQFSRAQ